MKPLWRRIIKAAAGCACSGDVQQRQQQWLSNFLRRNHQSEYARLHGLRKNTKPASFRGRVPVASYERLQPWINRLATGAQGLLTRDPVIALQATSGSTQSAKWIPYTRHSLDDFRRAVLPWLAATAVRHRIEGHIYFAASPLVKSDPPAGRLPVNLPDAAYLGVEVQPLLESISAVPAWVGTIVSMQAWKLATLYWLLRCPSLELVSIWSPTFLLLLRDALLPGPGGVARQLTHLLAHGGRIENNGVAADHAALKRYENFLQWGRIDCIWPRLKLISAWGDAHAAVYFHRLKQSFPGIAMQSKGLLATEAVMTVPDGRGNHLLAADSGFYEFIHQRGKAVVPAHRLRPGQIYEILVTTAGGLYRYRMGDLVRCEGFVDSVPSLRFVGRDHAVCDLAGEKLNEVFVADCLRPLAVAAMLVPRGEDGGMPGYRLLMEAAPDAERLRNLVEARLCRNPYYAHAVALGQLRALELDIKGGLVQRYLEKRRREGARLGDIKIPVLLNRPWLHEEPEHCASC